MNVDGFRFSVEQVDVTIVDIGTIVYLPIKMLV